MMSVPNSESATPVAGSIFSPQTTNGIDKPSVPSSTKLHGRAFYESIGSPRFVLAPMVDQSEFAWRMLSRSFIPPASSRDLLAYTPMMHARMFGETARFRDCHFAPLRESLVAYPPFPTPTETPRFLDGNPEIDRPLFVQFCANDPDELLQAAKYVAPFCDAVDLNLGCPQGIARKGKYGAFLQEDQKLIFSLINKLHTGLDVPITAKIRILDTKEETLAYARNVLDAGASILTIHGRTREMKGHKTGLADWKMIRFLRESLPKETVIFANGNILQKADIDRCIEETGADGVMSAEANLYDPAIFAEPPAVGQEGREYWRGKDGRGGYRMDAVFRRYMDIIYKYVLEVKLPDRKPLYLPSDPVLAVQEETATEEAEEDEPPRKKQKRGGKEKTNNPNLLAMQPHLFHLLRPLVSRHHHVRDALARCKAGDVPAFESVLQMVEAVVRTGLQEYAATDGQSWEIECENDTRLKAAKEKEERDQQRKGEEVVKPEMDESSVEMVRACRRPWWVVQPYVRPLPKEALAKGSLTLSKKERAAAEAAAAVAVAGGMGVEQKEQDLEKAAAKVEGVEGTTESKVEGDVPMPTGYTVTEVVDTHEGKREEVELPKEGLVCG